MPWKQAEDDTLIVLWKQGTTIPEIAKRLQKHPSTIKARRASLGLLPRRTGGLSEKVQVGFDQDTMRILRAKAKREGQTLPARIRSLVIRDTREP
jgi:transposase